MLGRNGAGDRAHRLDEPHLQHAIRFVEDECADAREVEALALDVIVNPARRADDDIHAVFE